MPLKKTVRLSKALARPEAAPIPPSLVAPQKLFTPNQVADRWHWHPESVRRALRQRRLTSVVISRRRLIPAAEVERVECEGLITRAA